jgi:hypothetical protein
MAEALTPAADTCIGVDAHQEHVDAGASLSALHGDHTVEFHRHIDDDGFDLGDFHRVGCPRDDSPSA